MTDTATRTAAAQEREARRQRIRDEAAREVASWPESTRRRLRRDFDRATAEADLIRRRGLPAALTLAGPR